MWSVFSARDPWVPLTRGGYVANEAFLAPLPWVPADARLPGFRLLVLMCVVSARVVSFPHFPPLLSLPSNRAVCDLCSGPCMRACSGERPPVPLMPHA